MQDAGGSDKQPHGLLYTLTRSYGVFPCFPLLGCPRPPATLVRDPARVAAAGCALGEDFDAGVSRFSYDRRPQLVLPQTSLPQCPCLPSQCQCKPPLALPTPFPLGVCRISENIEVHGPCRRWLFKTGRPANLGSYPPSWKPAS